MRWMVLALSIVCFVSVARADEQSATDLPTDDELDSALADPEGTAAAAYELGVRLFEAERYEAAERAWTRSNELGPNPTLWIAIADTRERRDDEPGTVAMLERYLVERPEAPDKAAVEARIATLLQTPARVTVRSTDEGHAILVDGKPIDRKTPTEIELEPGPHTILVVGGGKQVGEQQVQVAYGEQKELMFTASTPSDVVVEDDPALELLQEEKTTRRAVWTLSGISAAALISGTVLGFTAVKQEENYRSDPTLETANKGDRLALFADVSFGIAAVTAITALTVFLTTKNKNKRREKATARLRFESRGPGAAATFRF